MSACGAVLLAFATSSCSSGELTLPSVELAPAQPGANAAGAPGNGVTVYDFSNEQYFETHPDGSVTVRPAYEKTITITCRLGWGRSCTLGVGVPAGSACFCKSVWGAIWGHAAGSEEVVDSRFALPEQTPAP